MKNHGHVEGVNVCAGQNSRSQPARVYGSAEKGVGFHRSVDVQYIGHLSWVRRVCLIKYIHVQGDSWNRSVNIVAMFPAGRFRGWNHEGRNRCSYLEDFQWGLHNLQRSLMWDKAAGEWSWTFTSKVKKWMERYLYSALYAFMEWEQFFLYIYIHRVFHDFRA